MHIPIKVDYGVRALIDLTLHADEGPVRASDIAKRTAIPEPYLAQVLNSLNKHGLLQSQRGPQGGHALAMDPAEIRLSTVMSSLGAGENLVGCLENVENCIHVPACAQREVWRSVEEAVFSILDSTTVAALAERTIAIATRRKRGDLDPVAV